MAENFIQKAIYRFWTNGENFITEAIRNDLIKLESTVEEFLKLSISKQQEYKKKLEDK